MLIFEHSSKGRNGAPQSPVEKASVAAIPKDLLRKNSAALPEVSELQAVRHYTRLSRKNFSKPERKIRLMLINIPRSEISNYLFKIPVILVFSYSFMLIIYSIP